MTFQPADIPVLADAFPSGCHMKTMARLPVCAALPVCTQAMAQQTALKIDPAPSHSSGARFEIATDATSGESGNESRDRRMHREIPESAKYPEIVFRPDQVDGKLAPQGASQVKLHGRFEIHTAEHEITVPVDVQAANGKYQGDGALRRSLRAVGYEKPEHVHSARRQGHRNRSAARNCGSRAARYDMPHDMPHDRSPSLSLLRTIAPGHAGVQPGICESAPPTRLHPD
jgi:polyisoprenoid-binding protein YceI